MNSPASGEGTVAGSCKHGNELKVSWKAASFLKS